MFLLNSVASGGLLVKGDTLRGFDIAGADHKFVHAQATIDKDTVLVWADGVPAPVAVRYAWANNPMPIVLFNGLHLPVAPFRTDNWPGKTVGFTKLTVDMM